MACLLKAPSSGARGVVTFTTPERDGFIRRDPDLAARIASLKSRWLIGLHHNWHDFGFRYDPLFDFSLAGDGDLIEVDGKSFGRIPMDACNFVSDDFRPSGAEKFWDILFVAHPVFFKRVPIFFDAIRALYDQGHSFRVLHICPMPPYRRSERRTVLYEVRELYDSMFTAEEQDLFTLLTVDFRYPFPFDLPTLAHYYRSSRVFVHSADGERRCRVAAYAWATGMPVVASSAAGSLLPLELRREPYFFEASDDSYATQLARAVEAAKAGIGDVGALRDEFVDSHTVPVLDQRLRERAGATNGGYSEAPISAERLDIRLGRHHGIGLNTNSVPQTLSDFVRYLSERTDAEIQKESLAADPELAIAEIAGFASSQDEVERGLRVFEGTSLGARMRRSARAAISRASGLTRR